MSYPRYKKKSYFYKLDNFTLKRVPDKSYLGALFSEDLKFSGHISNVTKKANSTIGFLRRNLRYCPSSVSERPIFPLSDLSWSMDAPSGTPTYKKTLINWRECNAKPFVL